MRIIRQHNKKQDIQAVEVEPGDEGLLQEVEGGDEGLGVEGGDEGQGQQGLDEAGDEEGDEGGPNLQQQTPTPVDGEDRLFPVTPTVGHGFHFCVSKSLQPRSQFSISFQGFQVIQIPPPSFDWEYPNISPLLYSSQTHVQSS